MTTYFIDNTPCPGHSMGACRGPGGASNRVQLAADASSVDGAYVNYGITIVSGEGARGSMRCTAYNGTTKIATVHANWDVTPDEGSGYRITVGCNANNGLAEGRYNGTSGAWANLLAVGDNIAPGDTINVKAGTPYDNPNALGDLLAPSTAGTAAAPIVLQGYKDVPGDAETHWGDSAYRAEIDGGATARYGVNWAEVTNVYVLLKHLRIRRCGVNVYWQSRNQIELVNCEIAEGLSHGVQCGSHGRFIGCEVHANGGVGISGSAGCVIEGCAVYGNGGSAQVSVGESARIIRSRVYSFSAAGDGIVCAAYSAIDHNVVDGAGSGGAGINLSASGNGAATLANNAVVNCAVGVRAGSSGPALTVKGYNLYHNNASDFVNWTAGPGDVAADPLFVDEAGHDYRLRADSPAAGAGRPASLDIGVYQRQATVPCSPTNVGMQT